MKYFNNGDLRNYIDAHKNIKKPISEEEYGNYYQEKYAFIFK